MFDSRLVTLTATDRGVSASAGTVTKACFITPPVSSTAASQSRRSPCQCPVLTAEPCRDPGAVEARSAPDETGSGGHHGSLQVISKLCDQLPAGGSARLLGHAAQTHVDKWPPTASVVRRQTITLLS